MSLFVVSFISFFSWFAYSTLGKRFIEKHNKLIINKIRKTVSLFAQHLYNIFKNCSTDSSINFAWFSKIITYFLGSLKTFPYLCNRLNTSLTKRWFREVSFCTTAFSPFFGFIWQMEWRFCPCWAWLIASLSSGRCPGLCAAAPAGRRITICGYGGTSFE